MTVVPTIFELIDGFEGELIDLDELEVAKNFLGKTATEAYEMFCSDGSFALTKDFMRMGIAGLEYYLPPALLYLQSERSKGDFEFAYGLLNALVNHVQYQDVPQQLIILVKSVVEYIKPNQSKFIDRDEMFSSVIPDAIFEIELYLKRRY